MYCKHLTMPSIYAHIPQLSHRIPRLIGVLLTPFFLLSTPLLAQQPAWLKEAKAHRWADSIIATLSLREQVAQSFMVTAYSNGNTTNEKAVTHMVRDLKVGGLIFFQGTTKRQAELTNKYQALADLPLLIGIDGEWGLGMRLKDATAFPRAMALTATGMPTLAYRMGANIAAQMKRLGVHLNFAPIVDVNSNPKNPVIGIRAFSDDPEMVTQFALAYAQGMLQNGVLACAKHFPGHGNTNVDSHHALPFLTATKEELVAQDLRPFTSIIEGGISMVMAAHLEVPTLGTQKGEPASLSKAVLKDLLQDEMGFKGLVCSDALNMKGATEEGKTPAETALKAYAAGCDILLCPENVEQSIKLITKAINRGEIPSEVVAERCKKILLAKYWAIGTKAQQIKLEEIQSELLTKSNATLQEEIACESLTLLRDASVPISHLEMQRIGYVSFIPKNRDIFSQMMRQYAAFLPVSVNAPNAENAAKEAQKAVGEHTLMIITVRATGYSPSKRFGLSEGEILFAQECAKLRPTILVLFGTPYALEYFAPINEYDGLLLAYGDDAHAQKAAAQALFGGKAIRGKLPVKIPNLFPRGAGIEKEKTTRLGFSSAEIIGADSAWLAVADSLAYVAIDSNAAPGLQIVAAHKGQVFYQKNFGRFSYNPLATKITDSTLFDLASVTKIAATTPLVMRLIEKKKSD